MRHNAITLPLFALLFNTHCNVFYGGKKEIPQTDDNNQTIKLYPDAKNDKYLIPNNWTFKTAVHQNEYPATLFLYIFIPPKNKNTDSADQRKYFTQQYESKKAGLKGSAFCSESQVLNISLEFEEVKSITSVAIQKTMKDILEKIIGAQGTGKKFHNIVTTVVYDGEMRHAAQAIMKRLTGQKDIEAGSTDKYRYDINEICINKDDTLALFDADSDIKVDPKWEAGNIDNRITLTTKEIKALLKSQSASDANKS